MSGRFTKTRVFRYWVCMQLSIVTSAIRRLQPAGSTMSGLIATVVISAIIIIQQIPITVNPVLVPIVHNAINPTAGRGQVRDSIITFSH
jgi:hypothetical protein